MNEETKRLRELLPDLIKRSGSVAAFAKALDITTQYVYALNGGKRNASTTMIRRTAQRFGVSATWLFTGRGGRYMVKTIN